MERKRENVYEALSELCEFLQTMKHFLNAHLVDFFVDQHWRCMLPEGLRRDLESKTSSVLLEQIGNLSNENWIKESESVNYSRVDSDSLNLEELIGTIRHCLLVIQRLTTQPGEVEINGCLLLKASTHSILGHLDQFMSDKKMHEVQEMSDFISKLECSISKGDERRRPLKLIDVGSGKGYLSSFLSFLYNYRVLAIDSSETNTMGCGTRSKKLQKSWQQLIRRAQERDIGGMATKRGKHWKSKNHVPVANSVADADTTEVDIGNEDLLKTLTLHVNHDTDLVHLLKHTFDDEDMDVKFGIVGLHTCGTLGTDALRIFSSNDNAKFLCNVPCCFHLLHEKEGCHSDCRHSENEEFVDGFPVSNFLQRSHSENTFYLGRNARMLSAQSLHRIRTENQASSLPESLFFRVVLQMLIKSKLGHTNIETNVGRIGGKCDTFVEYTRLAWDRLGLSDVHVTDEDAETMYSKLVDQKDTFHMYFLLRSMFAPLVEGCILLDRLAYLLEQESIKDAFLVQLFNPCRSPRSACLVAVKEYFANL